MWLKHSALLVELEDKEDNQTTPTDPADVYGHIACGYPENRKANQRIRMESLFAVVRFVVMKVAGACESKCAKARKRSFGMASSMSTVGTHTVDSNSISSAARMKRKSKSSKGGKSNTIGEIPLSCRRQFHCQ